MNRAGFSPDERLESRGNWMFGSYDLHRSALDARSALPRNQMRALLAGATRPAGSTTVKNSGMGRPGRPQALVTGILNEPERILASQSRGPVSCTETPFESTATVTGMSATSNS